jgi:hypothetical protein
MEEKLKLNFLILRDSPVSCVFCLHLTSTLSFSAVGIVFALNTQSTLFQRFKLAAPFIIKTKNNIISFTLLSLAIVLAFLAVLKLFLGCRYVSSVGYRGLRREVLGLPESVLA